MVLDRYRVPCELSHLLVGEAKPALPLVRGVDDPHPLGGGVTVHHGQRLAAPLTTKHGRPLGGQGRFVDVELVRIDLPLHHHFA